MKWLTLTCITLVLGVGAALVGSGIEAPDGQPSQSADGSARNSAAAARRIFAGGIVEGAQPNVAMHFEIAGRLESVAVKEGQSVSKGDILARLKDDLWHQKLLRAEARLEQARAERERLINGARKETREVARAEARLAAVRVQEAKADLNRAVELVRKDALSDQDFDYYHYRHEIAVARHRAAKARLAEIEAEARYDDVQVADAGIRVAAAEVKQAQTMLEKTVLQAPTDGIILRVDAEPGELVDADRVEPVVTMANVQKLRVRAYVEELDALSLFAGQRAYVVADGKRNTKYHGTITWIAPSMGPKQHRHHKPGERLDVEVREVLILLDDPKDLVIGLPVDVFIDPAKPAQREVRQNSRESDGKSEHGPLPETAQNETQPHSMFSRRSQTGAHSLPLSSSGGPRPSTRLWRDSPNRTVHETESRVQSPEAAHAT